MTRLVVILGSHVEVVLSFAPDGSKLSLLEPRPITCPIMVVAARLAEDAAISRTVDEICAGRGSYDGSRGKLCTCRCAHFAVTKRATTATIPT
jgi:hypothetical protein